MYMAHYLSIWSVVIDAVIWWRWNASLHSSPPPSFLFFFFFYIYFFQWVSLLILCCYFIIIFQFFFFEKKAHHCRCRWMISRHDGSLFQSNVSLVIIAFQHLKALLIYRICLFSFGMAGGWRPRRRRRRRRRREEEERHFPTHPSANFHKERKRETEREEEKKIG